MAEAVETMHRVGADAGFGSPSHLPRPKPSASRRGRVSAVGGNLRVSRGRLGTEVQKNSGNGENPPNEQHEWLLENHQPDPW